MPKVTFVKSARKDNPVAKKGEPYYWWAFRYGGKRYSKTPPRPSQLTQSEYLGTLYSTQEDVSDWKPDDENDWAEELRNQIDDWATDIEGLGDECQEKRDNMPEGLQESDTGYLLEERYEHCQQLSSDIRDVDPEQFDSWQEVIDELGSLDWEG